MASLRNAIKRRTHKERAQPRKRRTLGILEKHKDYVERARNYRKKKYTLRHLKRKAEQRNPDEFYFGMLRGQTKNGIVDVGTAGTEAASERASLRHLRAQDAAHIRTKAASEKRKIERLEKSLHFVSNAHANMHTVYLDTAEDVASFDAAK